LVELADKVADEAVNLIKKVIPGENAWEDSLAEGIKSAGPCRDSEGCRSTRSPERG
jgi:hypothetical protein